MKPVYPVILLTRVGKATIYNVAMRSQATIVLLRRLRFEVKFLANMTTPDAVTGSNETAA